MSYTSSDLRRLVIERAAGRCEYCRNGEFDTLYGCQVDQIMAEKHHDARIASNLALTCAYCNRYKGTGIDSIVKSTGESIRFYNLRADN